MSGIGTRLAELVPRPFGIVHLIWAILILAGCVALAMLGGGHPPPMILVPPLLAAGLLGHLLQIGEARPGELPIGIALIAEFVGIAVYGLRARVSAQYLDKETGAAAPVSRSHSGSCQNVRLLSLPWSNARPRTPC